jgi:hypothetical protein
MKNVNGKCIDLEDYMTTNSNSKLDRYLKCTDLADYMTVKSHSKHDRYA